MRPRDPDADMCPNATTASVSTEECMAHQSYVPCPARSTSRSNSAQSVARRRRLGMIKQRRSSWRGSSATTAQLGGQDKNREVRRGRTAEERRPIRDFAKGARKHDSLAIRATRWTFKTMRTSCAWRCPLNEVVRAAPDGLQTPSHDRLARRCRTGRGPSKLALRATRQCRLAALTAAAPARLIGRQAVMACRERNRSRTNWGTA